MRNGLAVKGGLQHRGQAVDEGVRREVADRGSRRVLPPRPVLDQQDDVGLGLDGCLELLRGVKQGMEGVDTSGRGGGYGGSPNLY